MLALARGAAGAEPAPPVTAYDKPVMVKHVDLGPADTVPPQRKEVRCAYFEKFMVKEVDEREIGAAQLSILPSTPARPPSCQRDNLPGEQVVDAKAWSGYFDGAHGDYAIFRADDGVNGGLGFAVVRPADAGVVYSAVAKGPLRFAVGAGGATVLRFSAVQAGACSVVLKGAGCAATIGRAAGVAAPDVALCRSGYAAAKRQWAQDWCVENAPKDKGCVDKRVAKMTDWDIPPSVISYDAEVTLGPTGGVARPTGGPTGCWPSD